jgi:diguanylate cyclase (GGDEF)-like protein
LCSAEPGSAIPTLRETAAVPSRIGGNVYVDGALMATKSSRVEPLPPVAAEVLGASHEGASGWLLRLMADRGKALAVAFLAGGAQGVVLMVLPHWPVARPVLVFGIALAALGFAPLIWVMRHHMRQRHRHVVLVLGTFAASVAAYGCGAAPASMSAAYFYFPVVLYAAAYFRPVEVVGHITLVGLFYAAALAADPAPAFVGQWLLAMASLGVTTLMVGGFSFAVRQADSALHHRTFFDPVTGLGNRSLFLTKIDTALHANNSLTDPVAVLFLDLDDFKAVNESLGHSTGDRLLAAVARRLQSVTRAGDTVARLGGDEYALLLESGPMPRTAEEVARRIAEALEPPFPFGDVEVSVRASIGIAIGHRSQVDPEDLLRDADLAMYLAKQRGKNRFEMVRPGMQNEALHNLALITDLRHALHADEFEVFYQPIVRVSDTTPIGVEALVRWHHPHNGLLSPARFIDVAESTGLIVALGDWVLNQSCNQAQSWRTDGTVDDDFYISVNVSPRQLVEPRLVEEVARALRTSGLPPHALVLEITEGSIMLDFDSSLRRLNALRSLGVRIALDDFGTGYSSLNRLRSLPINIVKVDKSFIDPLVNSLEAKALVRSVIDVTQALGMMSVAEGVEDAEQAATLAELGCGAIQGYLYAKPAPASETGTTLRRLDAKRLSHPRTHRGPSAAAYAHLVGSAGSAPNLTHGRRR